MKSSGKTKVVLRHIPAFVDEKSFSDAISAFIPLLDWVQFVKAKNNEEYARGYINFVDSDIVFQQVEKLCAVCFKDDLGQEHYPIVEHAPFQRIPCSSLKPFEPLGSLEDDEDFVAFRACFEEKGMLARAAMVKLEESVSTEFKEAIPPVVAFLMKKGVKKNKRRKKKAKKNQSKAETKSVSDARLQREDPSILKIMPRDEESSRMKEQSEQKPRKMNRSKKQWSARKKS